MGCGEKQNMVLAEASHNFLHANIPDKIGSEFGAYSVKGWLHLFLYAIDIPKMETPSNLIIKDFNSPGDGTMNIQFVRALYSIVNGYSNIFVVILTQSMQVAQSLLDSNSGIQVKPMPECAAGITSLQIRPRPHGAKSNWSSLCITRPTMRVTIKKNLMNLCATSKLAKECKMPLDVVLIMNAHLCRKLKPTSPQRKNLAYIAWLSR